MDGGDVDEDGRRWSEEDANTSRRRRSFVWPLVALFMTAVAVGHIVSLKRRLLDFSRLGRQASSTMHANDRRQNYKYSSWGYTHGINDKGEEFIYRQAKYSSFEPDWQSLAEAAERLRRIRLMQEAFLKERARIFQRWEEVDWKQHDQEFAGDHWYWGGQGWTNLGMDGQGRSWRTEGQRPKTDFGMSSRKSAQAHHYSVLGLDPKRAAPYTDAEIKAAFRAKAMKYHPDRNQHRKDYAEAKFREIMTSYQALKDNNT